MIRTFSIALAAAALWGTARADAITDWNANAGQAAIAACLSPDGNPLHESRLYAMVHLAAYDAVMAASHRQRSGAYGTTPAASAEAAVAAAAHDVLVSQLPLSGVSAECANAGIARVESDYASALAVIPQGPAKRQGVTAGHAAAAAVIAARTGDGSEAPLVDPAFPQGTAPGQWRFTPGSPPVAFGPAWGQVKPFALNDAAQFRPPPPLQVVCDGNASAQRECVRYAADVEEIRRLGSDGVSAPSARSADQTEIALFWLESSPLMWNRIARTVSAARKLDLERNARLFALLNMAQADGYIASWATKFHYRFWRPVTAIREAANDGNPGTVGDPAWQSLRPTPPVPDYESAHALQGAAAARVIALETGGDAIEFSQCSLTLPDHGCDSAQPVRRSFRRLSDAAAENGESRILIGFHFRTAVERGLEAGRRIADWVVSHGLPPGGRR